MQRAIDGNNANGWMGMAYVYLAERDADGFRAIMEAQVEQYTLGRLPDSGRAREDIDDILAALDDPDARARGIAAALRMGQVAALSWFGAEEEILTYLQSLLEAGDTTSLANSLEGSIWFSTFKGVRQLPEFEDFLRDAGLADLWRERGWPDLCRPVGAEDFVCD
jgi:hypothetical protein